MDCKGTSNRNKKRTFAVRLFKGNLRPLCAKVLIVVFLAEHHG